jgi:hypothetical protein
MYVCVGYMIYKVEIIFTQRLQYRHTVSTFAWDFVCRSPTTLCWSVGALTYAVLLLVVVINFVIGYVSDIADYEIYHNINTCCEYKESI